jgi:hypothetical protein
MAQLSAAPYLLDFLKSTRIQHYVDRATSEAIKTLEKYSPTTEIGRTRIKTFIEQHFPSTVTEYNIPSLGDLYESNDSESNDGPQPKIMSSDIQSTIAQVKSYTYFSSVGLNHDVISELYHQFLFKHHFEQRLTTYAPYGVIMEFSDQLSKTINFRKNFIYIPYHRELGAKLSDQEWANHAYTLETPYHQVRIYTHWTGSESSDCARSSFPVCFEELVTEDDLFREMKAIARWLQLNVGEEHRVMAIQKLMKLPKSHELCDLNIIKNWRRIVRHSILVNKQDMLTAYAIGSYYSTHLEQLGHHCTIKDAMKMVGASSVVSKDTDITGAMLLYTY